MKAILDTRKPTVVFLINGRPLSINYVAENVPAVLEGWYLGGGNRHGRCQRPVQRSQSRRTAANHRSTFCGTAPLVLQLQAFREEGIPLDDITPLFPFGYGLSYSTSNLQN